MLLQIANLLLEILLERLCQKISILGKRRIVWYERSNNVSSMFIHQLEIILSGELSIMEVSR